MTTTAIPATTAIAHSALISLVSGQSIQVFTPSDLESGEKVTLERTFDSGATWIPVVDRGYRGVVLKDTVQSQLVNGPGEFRLRKSATAIPIAVYYD